MSYSLFFNDQKVNYFIQGQDLEIKFIFRKALFVIIFYRNAKEISIFEIYKYVFFRKPVSHLKTVTNIYNPEIYFLTIGLNPRLIKRKLNIHFLDIKEQIYRLIENRSKTQLPLFKLIPGTFNFSCPFNIINKNYKIKKPQYKLKNNNYEHL